MAHLLYTPEQVATSMLAATKYKSTLARLINQDFSKEFTPGKGASVTVRRPVMVDKARVYTAEDRKSENEITFADLVQPYIAVTLTDQVYQAVKLPDDFATFTLANMEQQVVAPMAESVAEHINSIVIAEFEKTPSGLLNNIDVAGAVTKPFVATDGEAYATLKELKTANKMFETFASSVTVKAADLKPKTRDDVLGSIRAAHQLLGQRGVPLHNRYLAVGANWEAALLGIPELLKVNEAGSDGSLRDATLGRLFGFTIVVDYGIDANNAYAFQRDAITLATRTTAIPRGVAFGSTVAQDGFTMRYIHDYYANRLTDRAVVDLFAGTQVLDKKRIVKLEGVAGIVAPKAGVGG